MDCVSVKGSQYIGKNGDTIQMLGDNQGALALAKNPHLHERSKHIDICYHFIRDLTEKGKVVTSYINTVDMVADGMTKPAGRVVFERFKKLLGLMEC
jgi:H2-forming N5,N10-methylenetetrahydromethanopterin dehydrogenase-like enzyme